MAWKEYDKEVEVFHDFGGGGGGGCENDKVVVGSGGFGFMF